MLKIFFTIAISGIILPAFAGDISIYVSPNGIGNGSAQTPTTLQKAIAMLPGLKKSNPKGTITIFLNNGDYNLEQPIQINSENGGTSDLQIVFKALSNAHPVVSGGKKITLKGTNVLSAVVQNANNIKPYDLYINGERAVRARTPNIDHYFTLRKVIDIPDSQNKFRFRQEFQIPLADFNILASLPKSDLEKVWFNMYHKWDNTMRTIDSLNAVDTSFYSTGTINGDWALIGKPAMFYFENYTAALDTANEWLLQNDTIKYIPQENVNEVQAVVSVLEKLLVIQGDSTHPVENILFDGIAFKYCNYVFNGYEAYQAAQKIDAAITIDDAQNIRFNNCEIAHTGQYAIWLRKGVQHCEITNSYLHDLGAGGIRIGETVIRENKAQWTSYNKVDNCIIHSGGLDFPSAVGIFIAQSGNNIISHNDVGDFRYTGISVGWIWGYAFSPAVSNKIIYNHIHHIGWGVLSDMAAVYTLGISNGTEVRHNRVNDIYSYDYGGWGLYTDEGSSNILLEDNLIYHTKTGGFHQHYGENNIIRNNIFAFNKKFQAQFSRVEQHHSLDFKNNIILTDNGYLLQGAWQTGNVTLDSNCYWNMNNDKVIFIQSTGSYGANPQNYLTLKEWQQKSGKDLHSIMQDPGFIYASGYDFRFKNHSTINKIGFKPFDVEAAGVTGNKQWKELAKLPKEVIEAFDSSVDRNMLQ
ncbi:right-handed parallel beta-helix repeat-containing protein [Ginsengibacter hankyongi]|uniref:Right-handed parallel beta-helix repeat-containing protein n=1 Tax=Ginsengibacter hankyongi TaxID=2607284 RepID=A0A5J5IDE1_9BACT|nr:right-handed parallel beta-helix repeat-containing protein [Ginsengibacter hankyongi]KAA9036540.1 right-handed parallel beta-helix repeat-containing protein [Ginsengibacter hankyongi]